MKKTAILLVLMALGLLGFFGWQQFNQPKTFKNEKPTETFEVCDEDGNRYPSAVQARAKGLSEAQYGATYCPEYLEAKQKKNATNNSSNHAGVETFEVCDEHGNRYQSAAQAQAKGLSEAQYGATYCPEYLEAKLGEQATTSESNLPKSKELCYQWISDEKPLSQHIIQLTSYTDPLGDRYVQGTDHWLPAQKDQNKASLKGYFDGDTIFAIARVEAEGRITKEERLYQLRDNGLALGYSEQSRKLESDGVYRYPNVAKIQYQNTIPKVDCQTINASKSSKIIDITQEKTVSVYNPQSQQNTEVTLEDTFYAEVTEKGLEKVRFNFIFQNAHLCSIEEAQFKQNAEGAYRLINNEGIYDSCALEIKLTKERLEFFDPENACSILCGARGRLHQFSLQRQ